MGLRKPSLRCIRIRAHIWIPPAHLFKERTTLDQFPVSQFVGTGLVIDCTDLGEGQRITMRHLAGKQEQAEKADFLLFHTGWDRYWGTDRYFGDYPYLDEEVVQYLIDARKKGVGLDVIGLDPISDTNLTLHKKLLCGNEIVVIENLTNLGLLGKELFSFFALPLKHKDADGSPIRAIAILDSAQA